MQSYKRPQSLHTGYDHYGLVSLWQLRPRVVCNQKSIVYEIVTWIRGEDVTRVAQVWFLFIILSQIFRTKLLVCSITPKEGKHCKKAPTANRKKKTLRGVIDPKTHHKFKLNIIQIRLVLIERWVVDVPLAYWKAKKKRSS